jgi:CheY-like chemotaxis protein
MAQLAYGAAHILVVEDNAADLRFMRLALEESQVAARLAVVSNGVEALQYLRRSGSYRDAPRPDLVLLDLHVPKKNGHEVLGEAKSDPELRFIPVVVLTTSDDEEDIAEAYGLHANCYVTKPFELDRFVEVVQAIERFWLRIAKLPPS